MNRTIIAAVTIIAVALIGAIAANTNVAQSVIQVTAYEADVNKDGKVNSGDQLGVAKNYGKPVPTVTSAPTGTPTHTPTATATALPKPIDGSPLYSLSYARLAGGVGSSVALADIDGDGKEETLAGAPWGEGHVHVFSGAGGARLSTINSPNPQGGSVPPYGWGSRFGWSVAAGDVDGDGTPDIAIGAPGETVDSILDEGRVYVFSGRTGVLLYTFESPNPEPNPLYGGRFGDALAMGDIDGDGRADIIVGADQETIAGSTVGRAYAFSGASGAMTHTFTGSLTTGGFGWSLAVGDVDGNGTNDVVVGALHDNDGIGAVYAFSGSGTQLFTLTTPNPQLNAYFGNAVALGDVDGDGTMEIAVGAHDEDVGTTVQGGRVYLFSGETLLHTFVSPDLAPQSLFGSEVALGDVNGDGHADIAVAASGPSGFGGLAYTFDSETYASLTTFVSPEAPGAMFGVSVSLGDVNGDGVADVAIGASGDANGSGRVYIW